MALSSENQIGQYFWIETLCGDIVPMMCVGKAQGQSNLLL
jgi:hypothetical protein